MHIWMSGHILKRNLKSWQNTSPLSIQSNSLSSCIPAKPYAIFLIKNEPMYEKQPGRLWLYGSARNKCPMRASSCSSTPLFQNPWLLVFEWCSNGCSWDFHPAARSSPVLDHNRPATGEEYRMLSVSFYIGALERVWGGGGEQRRDWVGEYAIPCQFPELYRRDHKDIYSKLCEQ